MSSLFHSNRKIREEFGLFLCLGHRVEHVIWGCIGFEWTSRLRAHRVGLEEFLEEWYERSAETCDIFDNISEVDKYSLTCIVCRYFEKECCYVEGKGPSIVKLLKATYQHDDTPWQPLTEDGAMRHQHCI